MTAKFKIVLKNSQGEVAESFDGAYEASKELNLHAAVIYKYCKTPDKRIRGFYWSKELIVKEKKAKPKIKKDRAQPYTRGVFKELQLRETETKQETRKRLGLSPYAYWCTPEGWAKLEEKVYPKLDAIGYFEEGAKAKIKATLKSAENKRKTDKEGKYVDIDHMYIDPEFQSYFKQNR